MKTVNIGIIGCGLMGREIASAAARWCHLTDIDVRPELVAVCDTNEALLQWYTDNFAGIKQAVTDYRQLLANPDVDAVYCAVPHNLHEEFYTATIEAGKHLLGEKPFGIDMAANNAIMDCIASHPDVLVRCSSQFPFFPAVQRIAGMIEENAFGTVIQLETGFLHSSDLNPEKAINWKRMIDSNGEYGCMGDLGMHVCHVPFRAGWTPLTVRAVLSNIMTERPDGKGGRVPCETWDNATLLCETRDPKSGSVFPWTMKTFRIAPGEMNTWYIHVYGTKCCARFSTKNPKRLEWLEYDGSNQNWQQLDIGYTPAFKAITGGIFEFGFSDALQQMIAGFLYEVAHGEPVSNTASCVTPEQAALSHRLFTAALTSQKRQTTEPVHFTNS